MILRQELDEILCNPFLDNFWHYYPFLFYGLIVLPLNYFISLTSGELEEKR
jgi:hypothetical protein